MKKELALLPVVLFAGLAGLFLYGLERPDKDVLTSPLLNLPAPNTVLPDLSGGPGGLRPAYFTTGKPVLVNFFASWCPPCHAEHPQLLALQKAGVQIYGIAVKDKPADTQQFLATKGNPYARIGSDSTGRTTINWGVYGYPESYMVDGKGIVRFKQVGDIRPEQVQQIVKTMQALEQGA
jgi:cytochrome c biogenesis protein CcmG, thiol:disulfide interchange protein DsbE